MGFGVPVSQYSFFASKLKKQIQKLRSKETHTHTHTHFCQVGMWGWVVLSCQIKTNQTGTFDLPKSKAKGRQLAGFFGAQGKHVLKKPARLSKIFRAWLRLQDVYSLHFCLGHSSKKAMSSLVISHFIVTCDSFAKSNWLIIQEVPEKVPHFLRYYDNLPQCKSWPGGTRIIAACCYL